MENIYEKIKELVENKQSVLIYLIGGQEIAMVVEKMKDQSTVIGSNQRYSTIEVDISKIVAIAH